MEVGDEGEEEESDADLRLDLPLLIGFGPLFFLRS